MTRPRSGAAENVCVCDGSGIGLRGSEWAEGLKFTFLMSLK